MTEINNISTECLVGLAFKKYYQLLKIYSYISIITNRKPQLPISLSSAESQISQKFVAIFVAPSLVTIPETTEQNSKQQTFTQHRKRGYVQRVWFSHFGGEYGLGARCQVPHHVLPMFQVRTMTPFLISVLHLFIYFF